MGGYGTVMIVSGDGKEVNGESVTVEEEGRAAEEEGEFKEADGGEALSGRCIPGDIA